MRYPIAIEIGSKTHAYGVAVPDIPGCYSAGDTIDEAIANAEDAILLALEDEKIVPMASKLEDVLKRKDFRGWTWALVDVDMSKLNTKAVRINVTIPDRVLGTIDTFATKHGETRSAFLTRAALAEMARES